MTSSIGAEGRGSIHCDGCGQTYTIHAYGFQKTRQSAQDRGWNVAGYQGARTDWCPDCTKPAPVVVDREMQALFDLEEIS